MKRFYFGIKNCETNTRGGLQKVYGNTYLMKSMHIFQILIATKINLHFSSIFHKVFEVPLYASDQLGIVPTCPILTECVSKTQLQIFSSKKPVYFSENSS